MHLQSIGMHRGPALSGLKWLAHDLNLLGFLYNNLHENLITYKCMMLDEHNA